MQQTGNYQLSQWEKADRIQMEDFNGDNEKIDAALAAETAARESLAAAVAKCGNCRVETFTYTGNGKYGSAANATLVTFSAAPMMFVIFGGSAMLLGTSGRSAFLVLQGTTTSYASAASTNLTWNGNQVSFYLGSSSAQLNVSDTVYQVIAFYAKDN